MPSHLHTVLVLGLTVQQVKDLNGRRGIMADTEGLGSQGSKRSQSVGKSHLLKKDAIRLGVQK